MREAIQMKSQVVAEIVEKLQKSSSTIVVDYKGLTVEEVTELRKKMREAGVEYMLEHVGEEYDGVISGVTGWGFYVELPNTVEGLVHIMTLKDDYYNFDEENYRLVGEQHGRVFRLGEPVRVRVRNAEPANRTIDFTYVEKETETE